METVWLVDSCLPPDGIPQVAEPPLRYLPSFIGGAWRGIGAEREELDLVEWLELSEAQFRRYPGCKTSISRVDVSCIVRYTRIFIPLTLHLANSNHIPSFLFAKIRSNVVIYIYKIETIKYPSLYNASWYILQPNNNEFARKREREKEIGDA